MDLELRNMEQEALGDAYLFPNEMIVLLAPHHPAQGLSLDVSKIIGHGKRADAPEILVSFGPSLFKDIIEKLFIEVALVFLRQAKANNCTFTWWHTVAFVKSVPCGTLGASTVGIDGAKLAVDNMTVERILDNCQA